MSGVVRGRVRTASAALYSNAAAKIFAVVGQFAGSGKTMTKVRPAHARRCNFRSTVRASSDAPAVCERHHCRA